MRTYLLSFSREGISIPAWYHPTRSWQKSFPSPAGKSCKGGWAFWLRLNSLKAALNIAVVFDVLQAHKVLHCSILQISGLPLNPRSKNHFPRFNEKTPSRYISSKLYLLLCLLKKLRQGVGSRLRILIYIRVKN
ncbi:unnamed protein product [Blepharisma stoltei]|uniref:Uncharacterized protein n=1 Tax=Blepharisma stoltei TaxID=1481888 RepID=A0AAU9IQN8_9CILI|nr:unnamed protein product [Blepharisma stoltei]